MFLWILPLPYQNVGYLENPPPHSFVIPCLFGSWEYYQSITIIRFMIKIRFRFTSVSSVQGMYKECNDQNTASQRRSNVILIKRPCHDQKRIWWLWRTHDNQGALKELKFAQSHFRNQESPKQKPTKLDSNLHDKQADISCPHPRSIRHSWLVPRR